MPHVFRGRLRLLVFGLFLALTIAASGPAFSQTETEVLTNGDIVRMVKAHLSANVIIYKIEHSQSNFVLTTAALVQLSNQGVPNEIIAAMQAHAPTAAQDTGHNADGRWRLTGIKNPMTDETIQYMEARLPGTSGGNFDVLAQCNDNSKLAFIFTPLARGVNFNQTPPSCAVMQVRAGDGPVQTMNSPGCNGGRSTGLVFIGDISDQAREATFRLWKGMMGINPNPNPDHTNALNEAGAVLANMMSGIDSKAMDAVGLIRMSDVVAAQTLRVQIPLSNGSSSVLDLDFHQPAFQKYLVGCRTPWVPAANTGGGGGIQNPNLAKPTIAVQHSGEFRGDVAGFNALLPDTIKDASAKWDLPLDIVDQEVALISKAAQTCAGLTPQVVNALSPFEQQNLQMPTHRGQYMACQPGFHFVTQIIRDYDHDTQRGLIYKISPLGTWNDGQGFEMDIMVTGIQGDKVVGNLFSYYGVMKASLNLNQGQ